MIAGHPFDTVKVRLQSVQKGGTTVNTFVNIVKHESVLDFDTFDYILCRFSDFTKE